MMASDLSGLARALIVFGLLVAGCGVVLLLAPKLPWIGRLPGDVLIRRDGFTFYAPLASSLLISLVISVIMWIMNRR